MTVGAVSAFGKIAALGDFVRIGAPSGFTDRWDRWLQQTMIAARTACGADWQRCYLSAPIWRFVLAPGLAGAQGVAGVMMPSVDRVGRQFPLALFAILPKDVPTPADAWFARLEDVALATLDDAATRDTLMAALDDLAPPPGAAATPASGQSHWTAHCDGIIQRFQFAGWPPPDAAADFFDPARWPGAIPQEARA
nr:type VI secretion system-associated protein TagF [Loktanella sp. M215]